MACAVCPRFCKSWESNAHGKLGISSLAFLSFLLFSLAGTRKGKAAQAALLVKTNRIREIQDQGFAFFSGPQD